MADPAAPQAPREASPSALIRLWRAVRPPRRWLVPVVLMGGVFFGLLCLAAHLGRATSYLSDDPKACINCHVMHPQYATWERGSHARVATCNDCHVPHDSVLRKYAFKAMDGTRHSYMFTFRLEPQVIRVHEAGINVIQENCQRCHAALLQDARLQDPLTAAGATHGEGHLCWDCHRETPHGRVGSLAAVPYARLPALEKPLPEWMDRYLKERKK